MKKENSWGRQFEKGLLAYREMHGLFPFEFERFSFYCNGGSSAMEPWIVRSLVDEHVCYLTWRLSFVTRCDSPIEEAFLMALIAIAPIEFGTLKIKSRPGPGQKANCDDFIPLQVSATNSSELIIEKQAQIDKYRVDFLLLHQTIEPSSTETEWSEKYQKKIPKLIKREHRVIVECDGHDFHERTKEQARHDKKRDRELQKAGYRVFRFTGSEIWKDPVACAAEIMDWVCESSKAEVIP